MAKQKEDKVFRSFDELKSAYFPKLFDRKASASKRGLASAHQEMIKRIVRENLKK